MKKIVFFYLCFVISAQAQDSQILYKLVELNKEVNSRYHETAPLVTPDNKRLYFTVTNHPENNEGTDNSQDIWYADKQADGSWGKAIHMDSPLNKRKFNQVFTILDDGNTLFIRGGSKKHQEGFSLTYKNGDAWTKPEELLIPGFEEMNQGRFSGAAISQDRTAIIIYMNERSGKPYSDLYISKLQADGSYSKPKMIESLSTHKDEFGPYLAENDQVMYYASNMDGGLGGVDIWKVKRLDDTWMNWSDPENLGPPINTGGFDSYFSMDQSGQNAFTTRTYISADGSNMNIYGLIPKAKITVKGTVMDQKSKKPLALLLTVQTADDPINMEVKADGQYEFTTYEDIPHEFIAAKIGYEMLSDEIDLSGTEKDTVLIKNLYLEPVKVNISLYGYILEAQSLLPANAWVHVKRNNKIDSVQTAYQDGSYQIALADEGQYEIFIKSDQYELITEKIEVTVPEGQFELEIRKDYNLNKAIKPYVIEGFVYDEQSRAPLAAQLSFEIGDSLKVKTESKEDGSFRVEISKAAEVAIYAQKVNYLNLEDELLISDDQRFLNYSKELLMAPIEVGKTVIIDNIYFNFDQATLLPESFPELDRLTNLMRQNPGIKIEISGHTDDKGSDAYNLTLSDGRAIAVMDYLIDKEIASDRMTAKGYGESSPISDNATEVGRAQNRRVEFTIVAK